MTGKNRSIVLTMSLVAVMMMAVGSADAGCKKLQPSGPLLCADWITGSEVCELLIKNLRGNLAEGAFIQCGVYGTYVDNPPTMPGEFDEECDPSSPWFNASLNCLLTGRSACLNPEGKYNENGTSFNLPGPLVETTATAQCNKGKCTTSAELEPVDTTGICNNNWTLTFTAQRFFGEVCVCPGGFDNNPADGMQYCCADNKRDRFGNCSELYNTGDDIGQPDCLVEYCEYTGNFQDYVFGQPVPGVYSCYETNPDAI